MDILMAVLHNGIETIKILPRKCEDTNLTTFRDKFQYN